MVFLIFAILLVSKDSFTQRISTFIGGSRGANFNTRSTLFPYQNNTDNFNGTGKILWGSNNPSFNVGVSINRIRKRGLVWSVNFHISSINHSFALDNNTFTFSPVFELLYLALDFNSASYSALSISSNFALGINLFHKREFSFSILGGPIIQNLVNTDFQFSAGTEFGPNRNIRLENYIGEQQIRSVMFGFNIFPQVIFRIKKPLHVIASANFIYFFNSMVRYNDKFYTMVSSPFRKNEASKLGFGCSLGIAYKL
jgi:hypothetical protein